MIALVISISFLALPPPLLLFAVSTAVVVNVKRFFMSFLSGGWFRFTSVTHSHVSAHWSGSHRTKKKIGKMLHKYARHFPPKQTIHTCNGSDMFSLWQTDDAEMARNKKKTSNNNKNHVRVNFFMALLLFGFCFVLFFFLQVCYLEEFYECASAYDYCCFLAKKRFHWVASLACRAMCVFFVWCVV